MKKQITLLTAIALFIAMTTNATVWRVNNRVNIDADFTTLAAAISGASANDTIYLEGSATNYGQASVSKPLTIIGTGYFLNENDSTQAHKTTSKITYITFSNGSQGSVIEGVTITGTASFGVTINTDDITVRRNHIIVDYPYGGSAIVISSTKYSIVIEQNWIEPGTTISPSYIKKGISFGTYPISTIIRNNIILVDTNHYAIWIEQENEAASLIITNNAIFGDMQTYYTSHYNNILIYGAYTPGTGDLESNNLCNATQYPNINGNQQNVVMSPYLQITHLTLITATY